jgi:hypothetical protein
MADYQTTRTQTIVFCHARQFLPGLPVQEPEVAADILEFLTEPAREAALLR